MRSRIYRFRVKLCSPNNERSDLLFEPTLKKAQHRAAEMLLLHNVLYDRAIVITPKGKETTYCRWRGNVHTTRQVAAWERKERHDKRARLETQPPKRYLVTTGSKLHTVYGVIETAPTTDHDLLFLAAAAVFQYKQSRTDLALHEVTSDNAILHLAAKQCVAERKFLSL